MFLVLREAIIGRGWAGSLLLENFNTFGRHRASKWFVLAATRGKWSDRCRVRDTGRELSWTAMDLLRMAERHNAIGRRSARSIGTENLQNYHQEKGVGSRYRRVS